MNIENCKEVLAYFCLPHTLSVRDDTKFVRMADGSLRQQKGEVRTCISANGIEFSEKLPPAEKREGAEGCLRDVRLERVKMQQQYEDIGEHGAYCDCYFCNPIV